MLQRLKKLFRRKSPVSPTAPRKIPATHHQLSPAAISSGAREVVATLTKAGHQALVVGGCVRDTLLGKQAKDFDVATDATPEQVRALFRRSRIIGRRFRIVHVHVGRELVEVTTFRAG
ncbi:MAG TPA: polynucleotide adenylyltransferase PcnB, partial [Porticoccaceae bacterium]|nr:polynucleotide adenylyltransferase PcnB [Porticoccaceae bacterium]